MQNTGLYWFWFFGVCGFFFKNSNYFVTVRKQLLKSPLSPKSLISHYFTTIHLKSCNYHVIEVVT